MSCGKSFRKPKCSYLWLGFVDQQKEILLYLPVFVNLDIEPTVKNWTDLKRDRMWHKSSRQNNLQIPVSVQVPE